jgi:hypothetical protein
MPRKTLRSKSKSSQPPKYKYVFKWLGLNKPAHPFVRKLLLFVSVIVFSGTLLMYSIGQYYITKHANEPLVFGATFIPSYAKNFGLDPKETMTAMTDELGIKRFRLVSYWSEYEKEPGKYNFDELDWQFKLAEEKGAKVSLAIGLRQPRWPECHMPTWAERLTKAEWSEELKKYMKVVIERYKDNPALVEYQLENEFFLKVFGICPDHSRERLVDEFNFVKSVDNKTPVVISRSNNALGLPLGAPRADITAVSVYKRVWDRTFTKRYFEYPLPPHFYAALAGGGEILTGRNLFVHELQTEAWLPPDREFSMNDIASIPEQNKSLNAKRLKNRINYGADTGMRTIDLWGVEWWYWRKTVANDPSLWNTAKEEISRLSSDK